MDEELFILLIEWGPFLVFLLILILAFIEGFVNGKRKTIIFLVHSIISFVVCAIIYFSLINNPYTDTFLLELINFFLGSKEGLQNLLNVSSSHYTLSACILEYIPNAMNATDALKLLLKDNANYLMTLVSLLYHIAFFIFVSVIFILLKFILWLTYIIFYSDLKYSKNKKYELYANNTDEVFRKRRIQGALINLGRGLVNGIVTLSLIGSVFFIATGGTKADKLDKIELEKEPMNTLTTYYNYIDEYSSKGIIGLLNSFADNDGTPYYLMLTDIVLQGQLVDKEDNTKSNVYLRKELSNYVSLAKKTINMINRYADVPLEDLLNNNVNIGEVIVPLLTNPSFTADFKDMIYDFDNESFALKFGLGIIQSAIDNIDRVELISGLSGDVKELLQILFKKGYYSYVIPEERNEKLNNNGNLEALPYLKMKNLLTKSDFCEIYDLVSEVLNVEEKDIVKKIDKVLPHITKLSLFNKDSFAVSPVLGRLYNFAACRFLKDDEKLEVSPFNIYKVKINEINWVSEIHYLADCGHDLLELYSNVYDKDKDIVTMIFDIFDEENEKYNENIGYYDHVCDTLGKSRLLGEVLQSNLISTSINDAFTKASASFEMPENVQYANIFDDNGKLIHEGEITNLLHGLKAIATNKKLNDCIKDLLNSNSVDMIDFLQSNIGDFSKKDNNGKSIFDYLIDSDILESFISAILIDNSNSSSSVLYIPSSALVSGKNYQKKNIIIKSELRTLFDNLPDLLDLIEKAKDSNQLDSIISSKSYDSLFNNRIVQGTIGKVLSQQFGDNNYLIIPRALDDPNEWVSTSSSQGEFMALINFIREADFKISDLTNCEVDISDKLLSLTKEDHKVDLMLNSRIIYYTISNKLEGNIDLGSFDIVIPLSCKERLINDKIEYLITKDEIKSLFKVVNTLDLKNLDTNDLKQLLNKIIINRVTINQSEIIKTTMINYLVNSDIGNYIDIPENLDKYHDGSKQSLSQFEISNGWHNEFDNLLIALDELFDLSNPNSDFELKNEYFDNKFESLLENGLLAPSKINPSKEVIDVCYNSSLISYTLTNKIDEYINSDLLVNNEIRKYCKVNNIYKLSEVRALLDAFDALEVKVDEAKEYDFMEHLHELNQVTSSGETKLEIIYKSNLLAGIFTEEIQDIIAASSYLVNHNKAYKKELEIYNFGEVKAIIDILGQQKFDTNFNVNDLSLSVLKNAAFETDDEDKLVIKSYLLSAAISKNIIDSDANIIIPTSSVYGSVSTGDLLIKEEEVNNLFDALISIDINRISEVDVETMAITKGSVNALSNSSILRATFAKKLEIQSNFGDNELKAKNDPTVAIKTTDISGNSIVLISQDEMAKLLNALFIITKTDTHVITQSVTLDLAKLLELSYDQQSFNQLLKSNILNIVVSEILRNYKRSNTSNIFIASLPNPSSSYNVIYFNGVIVTKPPLEVYDEEEISSILEVIHFVENGL